MSRTKRFIAGTIAGYGSLAANIVFTLVSVPLALAYLDKEQFGLWALAAQLNGYLILLELGMGNAINRHVADHKDDVNSGTYGCYILTSGLVYFLQGIIIASVGFGFSWIAPSLFSIPSHLASNFQSLVAMLATLSGISIASRSISSPLWGFQRLDVINYCFAFTSMSFLAFLWLGFHKGLGIFAFPLAQIPALLLLPIFCYRVCKHNGYYPSRGKWGKPQITIFHEIFRY
jgi:O-antigen/teichoic acid export membrane protein